MLTSNLFIAFLNLLSSSAWCVLWLLTGMPLVSLAQQAELQPGVWLVNQQPETAEGPNEARLEIISVSGRDFEGSFAGESLRETASWDKAGRLYLGFTTGRGKREVAHWAVIDSENSVQVWTYSPRVAALTSWSAAKELSLFTSKVTRPSASSLAPEDLMGTWVIDLRANPDDPPYTQELRVAMTEQNIEGSFYGSPMETPALKATAGGYLLAFMTHDGGGGTYYHIVELVPEEVRGISFAVDRDFVLCWQGSR